MAILVISDLCEPHDTVVQLHPVVYTLFPPGIKHTHRTQVSTTFPTTIPVPTVQKSSTNNHFKSKQQNKSRIKSYSIVCWKFSFNFLLLHNISNRTHSHTDAQWQNDKCRVKQSKAKEKMLWPKIYFLRWIALSIYSIHNLYSIEKQLRHCYLMPKKNSKIQMWKGKGEWWKTTDSIDVEMEPSKTVRMHKTLFRFWVSLLFFFVCFVFESFAVTAAALLFHSFCLFYFAK